MRQQSISKGKTKFSFPKLSSEHLLLGMWPAIYLATMGYLAVKLLG